MTEARSHARPGATHPACEVSRRHRAPALRAALAVLALATTPLPAIAQVAPTDAKPTVRLALLVPRGTAPSSRPRAMESVAAAVVRRTAVEAQAATPSTVSPLDARLFDYPLVFLVGSEAFEPWDDAELDAVRTYVSLGGMVVIDDQSGVRDSPFARRAKEEMSRALGGRRFESLAFDHAIFRSYYLLDRAWGRTDASETLTALVLDRRAAVIFSANDLLGACARDEFGDWALDVTPGGMRQRELAIRLGVNLVLYALTLDYKADLVHLPLILERRR